jgi:hypothetical protein
LTSCGGRSACRFGLLFGGLNTTAPNLLHDVQGDGLKGGNGIFIAEYEQGDIGDVLFRVACNMGLEGIVSKRLDRSYGVGKCAHWLKIKSPAHPVYFTVRDRLLQLPLSFRAGPRSRPDTPDLAGGFLGGRADSVVWAFSLRQSILLFPRSGLLSMPVG